MAGPRKVEGIFEEAGESNVLGPYRGRLYMATAGHGAVGKVEFQISFDGINFMTMESFDASGDVVRICDGIGEDAWYKFVCSEYADGHIHYRISAAERIESWA